MYLSKVRLLAPHNLSPGDIHQQIGYAFPNPLPGDERILWRQEGEHLLVQSTHPPVWRYARMLSDGEVKEVSLEWLRLGDRCNFRLVANTTRSEFRREHGEVVRGKRVGLYTIADQHQWLMSRSEDWGIDILSTQVSWSNKWQFGNVTLAVAQFDGILEVTDVDGITAAIVNGVGHAKGFGCGLFSLAPTVL